jgi:hypothetical protein
MHLFDIFWIPGVLLSIIGSYAFSFYLAGISMIFASCLKTHPIVHMRQRRKNHKAQNINLVCEKGTTVNGKTILNGREKRFLLFFVFYCVRTCVRKCVCVRTWAVCVCVLIAQLSISDTLTLCIINKFHRAEKVNLYPQYFCYSDLLLL